MVTNFFTMKRGGHKLIEEKTHFIHYNNNKPKYDKYIVKTLKVFYIVIVLTCLLICIYINEYFSIELFFLMKSNARRGAPVRCSLCIWKDPCITEENEYFLSMYLSSLNNILEISEQGMPPY